MSFTFEDQDQPKNAVVLVRVAENVTSKKVLFATFARSLNFPDYFGGNWDAFEECLRDLSWLPSGLVLVKHVDVPLINDIQDVKIYLAILRDAADRWSKSGDHQLSIVFASQCRDQLSWLLRLSP
jgi:RNAse (barnase) inhibitor barstar